MSAKAHAKRLLQEIAPSAIFCKGGFVSLPAALSSGKIPLIVHESDFTPGLANRLALKKCRFFCTSFEETAKAHKNGVWTGSPVRAEIFEGSKAAGEKLCGLRGRKNLLITGGSQGAAAINHAVTNALPVLTRHFDVVHITGKNENASPSAGYFPISFSDKIPDLFAWADTVVTRGGSNTLFELAALKKPSLIIPLPKSGHSRGDQVENAQYFSSRGLARVLPQDALTAETLVSGALNAYLDRDKISAAAAAYRNIDGTANVAKLIIQAANDFEP
jgi:UDP-N-acetylglucosamine--N-acetylmuramyl-(pentapeptide) pyrophosphoryl-undecaprenol N-acetylglucosamine transferase